jgi:hypothetical protein
MVQNISISSPQIAWERAVDSAEALLSLYYNPSYNPSCFNGSFWIDANALETLLNVKAEADLRGPNSTIGVRMKDVTANIFGKQDTRPLLVAPSFFDDALWWGTRLAPSL